KVMGLAVHAADRLRMNFGCTVLLVHHTGRASRHIRGSNVLDCNVDFFIRSSIKNHIVTLACEKQKDAPKGEVIRFRPREVELYDQRSSIVLDLVDHSSPLHINDTLAFPENRSSKNQSKDQRKNVLALQILRDAGNLRHREWIEQCEEHGISEGTFN